MNEYDLYPQFGFGRIKILQRGASTVDGMHFQPPTDVYETDEAVVVRIEVAGLQEGEFEVTLTNAGRAVQVIGRRQPPGSEAGRVIFHRLEIQHGSFAVELDLPAALEAGQEPVADYEDGFLTITLPKARTRHITPHSATQAKQA